MCRRRYKAALIDAIRLQNGDFMEYITLNNGVKMPQLGYGVYQVTKDECESCVSAALKVGYRLIDTAQSSFFSHTDPVMVEWFVKMAEERKNKD